LPIQPNSPPPSIKFLEHQACPQQKHLFGSPVAKIETNVLPSPFQFIHIWGVELWAIHMG